MLLGGTCFFCVVAYTTLLLTLNIGFTQTTLDNATTGFVVLSDADRGQTICVQFRSVLTSPTHVFIETPEGRSRQFFQKNVLEVYRLSLPDPADSQNFFSDSHIIPVRNYLQELNVLSAKYSCAANLLEGLIRRQMEVLEKYNSGLRRLNGRWLNAQEYARQFESQETSNQGTVLLRLKNGTTLRWPRVQIQGERLLYVSDIGVEAVHRDELVDEVRWVYFPDTRPKDSGTVDVSNRASVSHLTNQTEAVRSESMRADNPTKTASTENVARTKYTEGQSRFFRMKDGTTHIGRVIIADEDSVTIFTTAAKRYRLPRNMIVEGLDSAHQAD